MYVLYVIISSRNKDENANRFALSEELLERGRKRENEIFWDIIHGLQNEEKETKRVRQRETERKRERERARDRQREGEREQQIINEIEIDT